MNHRRNGLERASGGASAAMDTPACRIHSAEDAGQEKLLPEEPHGSGRSASHRETELLRDSLHILERNGIVHVISEDYSYKSGSYYSILNYELNGKNVRPASSAVLNAYIVPLCLEQAKRAGIPVCEWGISQGYVPLPSIIYGLNYFATSADLFIVSDDRKAKEVVGHVTNKGRYPFCYQKIRADTTIHSCVSIFGRTAGSCAPLARYAEEIYRIFSLPLVTMVFAKTEDEYLLSSLSPTRYSRISAEERALLTAYLSHQEFL